MICLLLLLRCVSLWLLFFVSARVVGLLLLVLLLCVLCVRVVGLLLLVLCCICC